MKQLLQYFTPNIEVSSFEKQKINAFIISGIIGSALVIILQIQTLLSPGEKTISSFIIGFVVIAFVVVSLFILKNYGIKITGNLFSVGIVVLLSISLNMLNYDTPAISKYVQSFYTILAIITVGALFASRKILIINAVIIFVSTTRVYFYTVAQSPNQVATLQAGYINHSVALAVITMIIYFTIKFAENSINEANRDAGIKNEQYNKLNEVFVLIKSTSETLGKLSDEINGSANSLSSNSSEQAANVEEISATMEEMAGSIIQNAENTETTAYSINNTAEFVEKSDKVIYNTLSAVQNISSKINAIQDISFQTNILAINAAIEAASAGDAGKGFSVVATEVKKLANNSASSAKEIVDLVNTALEDSDKAEIYHKTISDDIKKVNNIVNEISAAASEQQNSIGQINNSITQINEGAQRNAAISEQLAASVNHLAIQAKSLNKLLNNFRTPDLQSNFQHITQAYS